MLTNNGNPLVMLVKSAMIVTMPALAVLILAVALDALSFGSFCYAYGAILIFTACVIRPFLSNITMLTQYVNSLAEDRQPEENAFRHLSAVSELPAALIGLRHAWEKRQKHTASLITEYGTLVDSLPDILIMCDKDQKIVRTNRMAREAFGQNLAGRPLIGIIPNDELLNGIAAVMEERRGRSLEFHMDSPGTCDYRAIVEAFPAASAEGIAAIVTLNDVTELRRVSKMRADFVANASHEIRTPLASIKGFIETLLGPAKNDPEAHEQFLKIMGEQATRMKNLIDDLLTLSKIEMNEHTTPDGKADILQMVRKEKENFAWSAQEKNMTVRIDIPDDLPCALGEENEIRQVMHNLIGNAIKYGNTGTEVVVTARITSTLPDSPHFMKASRALCVAVIDSGEGIPRQHLPRLTERFYRVDSARTRTIGGTGLGLAIVKHIVNRHRGVLAIDSVVGEGSTFSIYLQAYDQRQ
jgi:two-component system phosphate regulon sensor histidine kinase PhoR